MSVHLADWPTLSNEFYDPDLIAHMDIVQNIVYLARLIRNKNQIKNRQPLRSLYVALSDNNLASVVTDFKSIITDELNVKDVILVENVSEIADIRYYPNFAVIRSKYPEQMGEIIKAIKEHNFELSNDYVELFINSESKSFDLDIVGVDYQSKDGLYVESGSGLVVSLDLTITQELKDEGIAREIVRNIQDARKQSGYEIMDRIIISIEGFYPKSCADYICSETLGEFGTVINPDISVTMQDDNGNDIIIKIKR